MHFATTVLGPLKRGNCVNSSVGKFDSAWTEDPHIEAEPSVSLLTDFEDAKSYLDWEVGTHGIYITLSLPIVPATSTDTSSAPSPFSSSTSLARLPGRQRRLTATYLPDVIPAQGWTKQEAVDSALRKAGFDGRITEEVRRAVKLRRYQSSVCSARWEEYWGWRQEATSANA